MGCTIQPNAYRDANKAGTCNYVATELRERFIKAGLGEDNVTTFMINNFKEQGKGREYMFYHYSRFREHPVGWNMHDIVTYKGKIYDPTGRVTSGLYRGDYEKTNTMGPVMSYMGDAWPK